MRVIHSSAHVLWTAAAILAVWPATAANDSFGAIAYSGTTYHATTGQSWTSTDEAGRRAVSECNRESPAKDCFVALTFQNACGALAIDYHGTWNVWWKRQSQPGGDGVSMARESAKNRALQECRRYAGSRAGECRVVADRCAVAFHP